MMYVEDAANAALEQRIARLNDVYVDCFRDGMDYNTLQKIETKIQKLTAKLGQQNSYPGLDGINGSRLFKKNI